MTLTTIKVPRELRDRIAAEAQSEGRTIAAYLAELLNAHEHRERMRRVGTAFAGGLDEAYEADLDAWDRISAGLPRA